MNVFNSNSAVCIILTIPITEGLVEDAFFECEPAKDAYETETGADGTIIRSATNNKLYNWKLHLKASTPAIALLSAVHAADRADSAGAGVGTLLFKQGSTLINSAKAWITKSPAYKIGSKIGDVTFEGQCECGPAQYLVGGL
jgi:hypothetical protein